MSMYLYHDSTASEGAVVCDTEGECWYPCGFAAEGGKRLWEDLKDRCVQDVCRSE